MTARHCVVWARYGRIECRTASARVHPVLALDTMPQPPPAAFRIAQRLNHRFRRHHPHIVARARPRLWARAPPRTPGLRALAQLPRGRRVVEDAGHGTHAIGRKHAEQLSSTRIIIARALALDAMQERAATAQLDARDLVRARRLGARRGALVCNTLRHEAILRKFELHRPVARARVKVAGDQHEGAAIASDWHCPLQQQAQPLHRRCRRKRRPVARRRRNVSANHNQSAVNQWQASSRHAARRRRVESQRQQVPLQLCHILLAAHVGQLEARLLQPQSPRPQDGHATACRRPTRRLTTRTAGRARRPMHVVLGRNLLRVLLEAIAQVGARVARHFR